MRNNKSYNLWKFQFYPFFVAYLPATAGSRMQKYNKMETATLVLGAVAWRSTRYRAEYSANIIVSQTIWKKPLPMRLHWNLILSQKLIDIHEPLLHIRAYAYWW